MMNAGNLLRVSFLGLSGLMAFSHPLSAAADLLSLTAPGEEGFRAGADPVEILIGSDMPSDMLPYLHVEIGAIDVTEFVQRSAQSLVYYPPLPLEPGLHQVRVVAVLPDGSIEDAAVWTIDVRASRALRMAEVDGIASLQGTQRVADDLDDPPARRTQGQGSAALSTRHGDADWAIRSESNVIYNSQAEQSLSGDEVELASYQIRGDWAQATAILGHQNIAADSLVLSEFNRRGVSAGYQSAQKRLQAGAFATRTEAVTGIEHFTGIGDSDQRTTGVTVTAHPFSHRPERLAVTAVYLDGKGTSDGVADLNYPTQNGGGTAQAIIVDSYLGESLWRLRGEYANSSFAFGGLDSEFGEERDDAMSFQFGYDTARDRSGYRQTDHHWGVNLMYQRVGPWFYSLGNIAITPDREITQLAGHYQAREFGISSSLSLAQDNVDDLDTLPTIETRSALINLLYTPQFGMETERRAGLFSNPALTLSWSGSDLDQIKTPIAFTGDTIDWRYQETTVGAAFSGDAWYWSLSHGVIAQEDRTASMNDVDTTSTSLSSQITLSPLLAIAPVLQQSRTRPSNAGADTTSWLAGTTLQLSWPRNWTNSLGYTVDREEANDGSVDRRTQSADLFLQWQYRQATARQPGVTFFTSASYRKSDDFGVDTDEYQAFVGVNFVLAR